MAPRRRRISAKLMEKLQMLKYAIRGGQHLNFTKGLKWSDELKEFEYAAKEAAVGEAGSYGTSLRAAANSRDEDDWEDEMDDNLDELEQEMQMLEMIEEEEEEEDDDDELMFG